MIRDIFGLATAVALIAAPAGAREHRRHHDRKHDVVAAFVAGAVIAGGLVALLSSKKAVAAPLPELTPEQTDAANLCADAAERQVGQDGREARVERFDEVAARLQGGWKVKGALRVADADDGYRMRFACTVKGASVRSVAVSI